ncbi:MAG TPA: SDR family oxidoreductase, partial [Candidatus Limnocylindrales bacterium]|nr:SDR family oxidoreductase [Candidatus Limnocylindrales bacterium]
MRIARPTLLLTGASGVLGRALIDELAPDFTIVALRHRTHLADPRLREFAGSLNDPTLGLSERDYGRLAASVDVVLHAAAATSWKATPESIRATNIDGTQTMLGFAERAAAPMYYVSTAFVANPPSAEGGRFASARAYIASKVEAEQLTRDSDVPTVIVRPSVVIGDSRDGRMAAFQGLHRVAGLIAKGMVPLIACDENALTDVVPQDVVTAATGRLIRAGVTSGEFWLTAGESAPTAGDLVAGALRVGRAAGLDPTSPRFIAAEAVDRLVLPLLADAISPQLRRMFSELLE